MAKDSKSKTVRKNILLAENIAKWLIIIVFAGAALTLVFLVAIGVITAVVIRPKIALLAERLRNNKKAMNGTAKERCLALYTEVFKIIPSEAPINVANMCTSTQKIQSADKFFDSIVTMNTGTGTDPAHVAHISSTVQAKAREHAIKSNTKKAANLMGEHIPEPEPHTPSHPASPDTNPAHHTAAPYGLGTYV